MGRGASGPLQAGWDNDSHCRRLTNAARLSAVSPRITAMPDMHFRIGATVRSVNPMLLAIILAAVDVSVGVGIGCGLRAAKTTLIAEDLPDKLAPLHAPTKRAVPHGCQPGSRDPAVSQRAPELVSTAWAQLEPDFTKSCLDHPKFEKTSPIQHLGGLGSGKNVIEVCLDEAGFVRLMLY